MYKCLPLLRYRLMGLLWADIVTARSPLPAISTSGCGQLRRPLHVSKEMTDAPRAPVAAKHWLVSGLGCEIVKLWWWDRLRGASCVYELGEIAVIEKWITVNNTPGAWSAPCGWVGRYVPLPISHKGCLHVLATSCLDKGRNMDRMDRMGGWCRTAAWASCGENPSDCPGDRYCEMSPVRTHQPTNPPNPPRNHSRAAYLSPTR